MSLFKVTLRVRVTLVALTIMLGPVLAACGDATPAPATSPTTAAATTVAATTVAATTAAATATPIPPTATPVLPTATSAPPTATSVPPTATPVPATLEILKISSADEVTLDAAVNDTLKKINVRSYESFPNLKGRVFVSDLDLQTVSKNAQDALKGLGYVNQINPHDNLNGSFLATYYKPNSIEIATVAVPVTAEFVTALNSSTEQWAKTLAPKADGKRSLIWLFTGEDILKYGYLLNAPNVQDVTNTIPGEADLPVYPNARRVVPDPHSHYVYYLTTDDYIKVLAFYKTNLPLKGWQFEDAHLAMFDNGGISVNRISKDNKNASISVSSPTAPAEFRIRVAGAGPKDTVVWFILP